MFKLLLIMLLPLTAITITQVGDCEWLILPDKWNKILSTAFYIGWPMYVIVFISVPILESIFREESENEEENEVPRGYYKPND